MAYFPWPSILFLSYSLPFFSLSSLPKQFSPEAIKWGKTWCALKRGVSLAWGIGSQSPRKEKRAFIWGVRGSRGEAWGGESSMERQPEQGEEVSHSEGNLVWGMKTQMGSIHVGGQPVTECRSQRGQRASIWKGGQWQKQKIQLHTWRLIDLVFSSLSTSKSHPYLLPDTVFVIPLSYFYTPVPSSLPVLSQPQGSHLPRV